MSAASTREAETLVRRTHSPCPSCTRVLETEIVQRGKELYMRKVCPEHGPFEVLFKKDAEFYRTVSSLAAPVEPYRGEDAPSRSEERRVGKECRSRWSPYH